MSILREEATWTLDAAILQHAVQVPHARCVTHMASYLRRLSGGRLKKASAAGLTAAFLSRGDIMPIPESDWTYSCLFHLPLQLLV